MKPVEMCPVFCSLKAISTGYTNFQSVIALEVELKNGNIVFLQKLASYIYEKWPHAHIVECPLLEKT